MEATDKSMIIKWILVIVATIALGAFILMSPRVPDQYRLWLAVLDYAFFTYANFKVVDIRKKARQKEALERENRAARRQAARLKNK